MRTLWILILLVAVSCSGPRYSLSGSGIDPYRYSIEKSVMASKHVVVSAHPLASKVGLAVMNEGGNAFDAAIATQFALAVVYPNAGNLGGGGFMVALKQNGEALALDYREMAPALAHRDMYLDKQGKVMEGRSVNGHLSSGVPGTVAGIFETLKYARLPLRKLIAPAIELADKGFTLTASEAASLNRLQDELLAYNTRPTAFQRSKPWKAGDTLVQKELAATLSRIRDGGRDGFYKGRTADLIVEEMARGGGIIAKKDLEAYTAKWRSPHRFPYKGYEIVGMPMPSSGGVLLHQMLKMVENRGMEKMVHNSAEAVQLMIEVERRAYADRATYMGDADFFPVPVDSITSDAYLSARMQNYDAGKPTSSKDLGVNGVQRKESEETTHISIIDGEGNAVSVTTTLNNSYGSKTVVGGAGFFLNDEMDDFSVKPGTPNIYGAIGGEANSIQPRKRMLSSMTPTIVLRNGKAFMVVGTPGGTTIPTSVFQSIVNVIDFRLSAAEAVNGAKFHHQWLPDSVFVERSFPKATINALEKMGYKPKQRGAIGRTELILVHGEGKLEGVADNRGDDSAAGN